jgi:dihydroneopterin aldolase/2-amino-4-hydroxy-6-hydroxymethyldihydropteridine diphosphokinase
MSEAEQRVPRPVVLALGANLGDPLTTLTEAVEALATVPGLAVTAVSPLSRTAPVGGPEQPPYLNAVVIAETTLSARQLLASAPEVEAGAGRERAIRWGPRTLDIDLIQYGAARDALLSDDPELTLPHPRAAGRAFVLVPWSQAEPAARLADALGTRAVALLAAEAPDLAGLSAGPDWPAGSCAARLVAARSPGELSGPGSALADAGPDTPGGAVEQSDPAGLDPATTGPS